MRVIINYLNMPSNVRVAIRLRPLLPHELEAGHTHSLLEADSSNGHVSISQNTEGGVVQRKTYKFDKVINETF